MTDKPGFVVGQQVSERGTFIPNSRIVEAAAKTAGLQCTERRSRELPAFPTVLATAIRAV